MQKPHFSSGDTVVLKTSPFRSSVSSRACHVLSVLPKAYGLVQYRVRFQGESCERRVTEEDIDFEASPASSSGVPTPEPKPTGSWVNAATIRIKK